MNKRMDKYTDRQHDIPSRTSKNKELYSQIYNAYDEFENLIVPPNSREITAVDLKHEITSRDEYRKIKEYHDITNNVLEDVVDIKSDNIEENTNEDSEIYDIKELLDKAVVLKKDDNTFEPKLTKENYLKKLKLDDDRTNLEQIKEMYEEDDDEIENEELLKTANLSLEILTDLKSDEDKNVDEIPVKEDLVKDGMDEDFYSNTYKFSKKDFDDKKYEEDDDEDYLDNDEEKKSIFFKIFFIVLAILLSFLLVFYLFNYFSRI